MRCSRKKQDGKQCKARALRGNKYCALHADPGKAAELARRARRARVTKGGVDREITTPIQPPKTAEELRDLLAGVVVQVKSGEVDAKTANALAYTGTALLRAIEMSSYESRMSSFEERLSRLDGREDRGDDDPESSL